MKRVIVALMLLVFITSLASAEMIFNQQPKEFYSLGDSIDVPITVKTNGDITGVLNLELICNGAVNNFYKNGISLNGGEEKRMEASLILTKEIIGTMLGNCKIKAYIGEEYIISNEFTISNVINLELRTTETNYNPGDNLILEGNAIKEDGKSADGFISMEMTGTGESLIQTETINNGYFKINISLPENLDAGDYSILLNAYEKDSLEEITNTGSITHTININQIPTNLEIMTENELIEPGTSLQVKTILHDQSGVNIPSTSIITIKNAKDKIFKQEEIATDEFLSYEIAYNEAPSIWKLYSVSNKLEAEGTFEIIEKRYVEVELINRTLTIYNKGNVPYNKTVTIKIENETLNINTNLQVDSNQKYILTAPDGEYAVEILGDGESKISGRVALTGNTINVKELSGISGFIKYPMVWMFMIAILGFVAFMVVKKGYKRSFIGHIGIPFRRKKGEEKTSETLPLSKNSLIKTSNRAELTLSLKGDKQNVSLVSVKIKNLREIQSNKSGVEEILQKIVSEAEESKAVIYENQDNLFFIFAPVKTKTFSNEKASLKLAQGIKETLDSYNKLAKQKIDFGISLNYGTVVAKQEKDYFKFMSMGTLITLSKKIATISTGEILLSEKVKERTMSEIKTEKHERNNTEYYSIKEIRDRDSHGKFIGEFIKRLEGKK